MVVTGDTHILPYVYVIPGRTGQSALEKCSQMYIGTGNNLPQT